MGRRVMQAMKGAVTKKTEKLQQQLGEHGACSDLLRLRLPLPLDPTAMLEGILPEHSLVFKSAMSPMLLAFAVAGGAVCIGKVQIVQAFLQGHDCSCWTAGPDSSGTSCEKVRALMTSCCCEVPTLYGFTSQKLQLQQHCCLGSRRPTASHNGLSLQMVLLTFPGAGGTPVSTSCMGIRTFQACVMIQRASEQAHCPPQCFLHEFSKLQPCWSPAGSADLSTCMRRQQKMEMSGTAL